MIFYVLLTHGAKPTGKIDGHPAARAQIANLKALLRSSEQEAKPQIIFDYSRKIRGLKSLPKLSLFLEAAHERGSGKIVMDNIGRLFTACEDEHRVAFWEELRVYQDHLFGLKQGGLIVSMNHKQHVMMVSGRETTRYTYGGRRPRTNMSELQRKQQTFRAKLASQMARGQAADEKARELADLRKELTADDKKPTLKLIAEEANNRGLTTTRGGPWSSSTVGRTLKRLDETPQTESDANDQDQE